MLTVIDLFSGCGGISRGFQLEGFTPILGLDNEPISLETFARNSPSAKVIATEIESVRPSELREYLGFDVGELDCLVGGPPCQSYSKNTPAKERFFDDHRNHLYKWFMEFVEEFRPKAVLIENVAELANAYNGLIREEILDRLSQLGYNASCQSILAAEYGVPQKRRRLFFLASRDGGKAEFPTPSHVNRSAVDELFPKPEFVTVREAIGDMLSIPAGGGTDPSEYGRVPTCTYQQQMRNGARLVNDHVARPLRDLQMRRIRAMRPGMRMTDLPKDLQTAKAYGGAYARMGWDDVSLTITTWMFHPGSGRFGHPEDDRTITIREAARIQGFDDDFQFCGTYTQKSRQVGNAVPPLLARQFATVLKEVVGASGSAEPDYMAVSPYPIAS